MRIEQLMTVEYIEYQSFKEKLDITKKYSGKAIVEIVDDKYVYIEQLRSVS